MAVLTAVQLVFPYGFQGIELKSAQAASNNPKLLNYQARITDDTGIPVADGTLNVAFAIYSTSSGASGCLWSASNTDATDSTIDCTSNTPDGLIPVTVKDGVFSVVLGDTSNGQNALPDDLFDGDTRYLGITVESDSEMTPRKRITSAPYAFNADRLDDLDTSSTGGTGAYVPVTDSSGNFTITGQGTFAAQSDSPTENLFQIEDASGGAKYLTVSSTTTRITTTGNQLELAYDDSNDALFTVDSTGNLEITIDDGGIFQFDTDGGNVHYFQARFDGDASGIGGLIFRTDIVDDTTILTAVPNGTGDGASFKGCSDNDCTEYRGFFDTNGSAVTLRSDRVGSNPANPITFELDTGTDTLEMMRIQSDGYVGIGNESPSANLTVSATGSPTTNIFEVTNRLASGTVSNTYFTVSSTNTFVGSASNTFTTAFRSWIASNFTPSTDDTYDLGDHDRRWRDLYLGPGSLHIGSDQGDEGTITYDTGTNELIITAQGGVNIPSLTVSSCTGCGGGSASTLQDAYDGATSQPHITLTSADGVFSVADNGTPLGTNLFEVLDNVGNRYLTVSATSVGINRSSPNARLHVAADDGVIPGSLPASSELLVSSSSDPSDGALISVVSGNTGFGGIQFGDTDSHFGGYIRYGHDVDDMRFYTNASEQMRIESDGDVVMGDTTTDGLLKVQQDASADIFNLYDGSTNIFTVLDGGNTGIGTVSPETVLHVAGDAGSIPGDVSANAFLMVSNSSAAGDVSSLSMISGNAGSSSIVFGDTDAYFRGLIRYGHDVDDLRFYTAAEERMKIDASGNVGIGTLFPNARLTIGQESGSATNIFEVTDPTGNTRYLYTSATGTKLTVGSATPLTVARSDRGEFLAFEDGTDDLGMFTSDGTPESSITADRGSIAVDTTNGDLYIKTTDGVSTGWSLLDTTTANPDQFAIIADVKSAGTNGGAASSGVNTRDLNTELYDPDGIVSISSNQFTLQAGTYEIDATAPFWFVQRSQAYLYNVTDAQYDLIGTSEYGSNNSASAQVSSRVHGVITLSSAKTFEIRHYAGVAKTTDGLGVATNNGENEIYTRVAIRKFQNSGTATPSSRIQDADNNTFIEVEATTDVNQIRFNTETSGEVMRIADNGYVLIGNTTGEARLTVADASGTPTGNIFEVWNAGNSSRYFSVSSTSTVASGRFLSTDGSTSAPGIAFSSNSGIGISSNGSNLSFSTESQRRMRISNAGTVLIDVAGESSSAALFINADADTGLFSPGTDELGITAGGYEALRIGAPGNVIVSGTGTPTTNIFEVRNLNDSDAYTAKYLTVSSTNTRIEVGSATPLTVSRTDSGEIIGIEDGSSDIGIHTSDGSPESSILADRGSLALDTTNGSLYIKTTSATTTGWTLLETSTSSPDQVAIIADVKSANTSGGTSSTGVNTRTLNTELYDADGIVSISSNQFTLQAGTYRIHARVPAHRSDRHQAYLYNVTDAQYDLIGSSGYALNTSTSSNDESIIDGVITISSSKTFEIRHYIAIGHTTYGLGVEANNGENEIYTKVTIRKMQNTGSSTPSSRIQDADDNTFIEVEATTDVNQIRFNTETSGEVMRILDNGYVGIGETSPNARFTVAADSDAPTDNLFGIEDASGGTRYFTVSSTSTYSNSSIYFPSSNVSLYRGSEAILTMGSTETVFNDGGAIQSFRIEGEDDANAFYVASADGDIGIGTASPSANLHLYENTTDLSTAPAVIIEQDGTGDVVLDYRLTGVRNWVTGIDNSDSDAFKIASSTDFDASTWLSISTAGLVTANGSAVVGDASTTDTVTFNSWVSSNLTPSADDTYDLGDWNRRWRDLYLSGNSIHIGGTVNEGTISFNTSTNQLEFDAPSGVEFTNGFTSSGDVTLGIGKKLVLDDDGDTYLTVNTTDDRWSLVSGGTTQLSFNGTQVNLNDALIFNTETFDIGLTNSNRPRDVNIAQDLRVSGQTGLGTKVPTAALTVGDDAGTGNILEVTDDIGDGTYTTKYFTVSSTSTLINTGADTSYRVGIGTTAPTAVLEVDQGNVTNLQGLLISSAGAGTTGLKIGYNGGGDAKFGNLSGSSVQIGSTNRAMKFVVANKAYDTATGDAFEFTQDASTPERTVMAIEGNATQAAYILDVRGYLGAERYFTVSSTSTQILAGSASEPGLGFIGDEDSGLYGSGSGFYATVNGTQAMTWGSLVSVNGGKAFSVNTGSAAGPGIRNNSDADTGIFFPSVGFMGFTNAGTESMRLDDQGNVLIGADETTTAARLTIRDDSVSPATNLLEIANSGDSERYLTVSSTTTAVLDGTVSTPGITFMGDTNSGLYLATDNTVGIATNGQEKVTVSNAQLKMNVSNTAISTPQFKIEQDSTGDAFMGFGLAGGAHYMMGIDNSDSDKFKIGYNATTEGAVNGSERLSIDVNGVIAYTGRLDAPAHTNNSGLNLPTNAGTPSAVTATAEGDIVWDSTGDALYVYNGSSFTEIGGGGIAADSLDYIDFEDTMDLDAALTLNQTTNTWSQTFTGTTTTGFSYAANSLTSGTAYAISSSGARTGALVSLADSGVTTGAATLLGITSTSATAAGLAIGIDLDNGNNDNKVFTIISDETTVSGTSADTEKLSITSSGSLSMDGDLQVNGDTTLGSASDTDNVTFNSWVASNIAPDANATYDLGNYDQRWRDLYLSSGTLHIGTSVADEAILEYDTSANALLIKTDATTSGDVSVLGGMAFFDNSLNSVALGRGSSVSDTDSFAFGDSATASGQESYAIGLATTASCADCFAIGTSAEATTQAGAMALGNTARSYGINALALGVNSSASGTASVSIGDLSETHGSESVAIGYSTITTANYSGAFGYDTAAHGQYSLALNQGTTYGTNSTAIGQGSEAHSTNSMAIGWNVDANTSSYAMALGRGVNSSNQLSVSTDGLGIGFNSTIPTMFVAPGSGAGTLGAVGLGTTSPSTLMHIVDATNGATLRIEGSGTAQASIEIQEAGDSGFAWTYEPAANRLDLVPRITGVDSATSISILRSNGNVGFGTTTPDSYMAGTDGIAVVGSYGGIAQSGSVGSNDWLSYVMSDGDYSIYDATGTADRLVIEKTTGDVGIGTTAPSYDLDVSGYMRATSGIGGGIAPSSGYGVRGSGTTAGVYGEDGSNYGYVGYGSYAMYGISSTYGAYFRGGSGATDVYLGYSSSYGVYVSDAGDTGVYIPSNSGMTYGIRAYGVSTAGRFYDYNGTATTFIAGASWGVEIITGGAVKPGGGSWSSSSDQRIKKDVYDFEDGLDVVRQFRPVNYTYNGLADSPEGLEGIGFIAQEVQDVAPYLIQHNYKKLYPDDATNTDILLVDPSSLPFININAIQELDSLSLKLDDGGAYLIGTATGTDATSTTEPSRKLKFTASAWNSASSTSVTRDITMSNTISDMDTYNLEFLNDDAETITKLGQDGSLYIAGKLFPSDRGTLQEDKYIFYDGSAGPGGDMMRTNAAGWSTGSYDFAEMFPTREDETLEPGTIVMADTENDEGIIASKAPYENAILGIISTKPGFLAGDNREGDMPVALIGRVPTKVNLENGPIHIGDPITSSSEEGIGMKANEPGRVVGIALQNFDGTQTDEDGNLLTTITVYVNPSWWNGPQKITEETTAGSSLTIEANSIIDFQNSTLTNVEGIIAASGMWSIGADGHLVATHVQADTVTAKAFKVDVTEEPKRTAGVGEIKAGYKSVLVQNPNVTANSLIVATFEGNPGSAWWISEKQDGQFMLELAANAPGDVKFTYWLVGVDGDLYPQVAGETDSSTTTDPVTPPTDSSTTTDPVAEPPAEEPPPPPPEPEPEPDPPPTESGTSTDQTV